MIKKTNPIVIIDHRPEWAAEYEALAQPLRAALGDLALRVDHIGSTAVPGLAAKDIIDIQVTVPMLSATLEQTFALAGYQLRAENARDHRPPTATGPADDWVKQYYQPAAGMRPVHVHVRRAGSANGRYALLFRDYLRATPLAAQAYEQVKRALAAFAPDGWDHYYDVKDPVCDIIMAGAETWAAATGWRQDHYSSAM
jgi:GrpB-like predicted nucleotidyltransferase (UPF0157 family)